MLVFRYVWQTELWCQLSQYLYCFDRNCFADNKESPASFLLHQNFRLPLNSVVKFYKNQKLVKHFIQFTRQKKILITSKNIYLFKVSGSNRQAKEPVKNKALKIRNGAGL